MWNDLTLSEKARMMQLAVKSGIKDLRTIEEVYNTFKDGGDAQTKDSKTEDYKTRLIRWAVENEGGLWQDTPEASRARQWLRNNAPEELDSLYWVMEKENRERVNPKFLSNKVREKLMESSVTEGINSAGKNVYKSIKTALDFTPVMGDIIQGAESVGNLASGKYNEAVLGLFGLALPNIVEKPLKYATRGLKVLKETPKYLYIKNAIKKDKNWNRTVDNIRDITLKYNLDREAEIIDKNPITENLYESIINKPYTTKNIDPFTESPIFNADGSPSYIQAGTNVKIASWSESAKNIINGNRFAATAGPKDLDNIIIYPMGFSKYSFHKQIPSTLAHEFQHRAQRAFGYYDPKTRPVLKDFTPTSKTSASNMPIWGKPSAKNPAYKEMSVLEGPSRSSWIQNPNEVDAEMAYLRYSLNDFNTFNSMAPRDQNVASEYIAKRFNLDINDSRRMLEAMSREHYKNGGSLYDPQKKLYNPNYTSNPYKRIPNDRYETAYTALRTKGYSGKDSDRLAKILASQSISETGWIDKNDSNNYAGYLTPTEPRELIKYATPAEFWSDHIDNLTNRWPEWSNAKTPTEYFNTVNHTKLGLTTKKKYDAYNKKHKDNPVFIYAPDWENTNYLGRMNSVHKRASKAYPNKLGPVFD